MDVSFFAPLVGMGINLAPPVVVATIIASWGLLYALDERDGVLNHPNLRIAVPFVCGIALFLVWRYSYAEISKKDIWDGLINATVSVGVYNPIKKFLQSKGFGE